jgi:hypothetical protein
MADVHETTQEIPTGPPKGAIQDGLRDVPREPPMRVVTSGWWIMREEMVPREVLEARDRESARRRASRFSLKKLIFGRG